MLLFELRNLAGDVHPFFEQPQKLIVYLVNLRPVIL
jgi:hypothetical protein